MKKIVPCAALVVCMAGIFLRPLQAAEWIKIHEHDGIMVYERQIPGTALVEFMGVTVINTRMEIIGEVLRDVSSHPLWVTDCSTVVLKKKYDRNTFITHMVLSPPLIQDRDVVIKNTTAYDFDSGRAVVSFSCSNEVDVPVKKGRTRISVMNGSFEMEYLGRERTKFIYRLAVDPGGDIPRKLAYTVMRKFPFDTLEKLKAVVRDKKYAAAARGTYEEEHINLLAADEMAVKKVLRARLVKFVRDRDRFVMIINSDRMVLMNIAASGGSYESIEKATFDLFFRYFERTIPDKSLLDRLKKDNGLITDITTMVMYGCDATNTSADIIVEHYMQKYSE